MNKLLILTLVLTVVCGIAPPPGVAQNVDLNEKGTMIDSTFTTEDGTVLRYRGFQPAEEMPSGPERNELMKDERVPMGYGWKTIRYWKQGDIRPQPRIEKGRVITEFVDLHHSPSLPNRVVTNFAEYMDYVHFAIKDLFGWDPGFPVPLVTPLDMKDYGKDHALCWWVPGDCQDGKMIIQPIAAITSRGFAMEALTHYYVEWLIRHKTGDRVPAWFLYGAGAALGAEGWVLKGQVEVLHTLYTVEIDQATMIRDLEIIHDPVVMEKEVAQPGIMEDERCWSRIAYWRAFRLMENILLREGQRKFKDLIETMEADPALTFEDGVSRIYGKSVEQLVADNEPW